VAAEASAREAADRAARAESAAEERAAAAEARAKAEADERAKSAEARAVAKADERARAAEERARETERRAWAEADERERAAQERAKRDRAAEVARARPARPVEHYDDLAAEEVIALLASLEAEGLQMLKEYERDHANRTRVLSAIDSVLARGGSRV
jgi:hypothetical protein